MGGTDSGDQRVEAYYRPEVKTISWVPRVLAQFLNTAVVINSFTWHTLAFPMWKKTHYDFREALVDRLVGDHLAEKVQETGKITERSRTLKQWTKEQSRFVGLHWTVQERRPEEHRLEGQNPSDPSKERSRNWFRGHCMLCGRSVPTKCEQCRVYLCTDIKEDTNSTCMKIFHEQKNLEKSDSTAADDDN
jgi:hypothetical protein